MTDKKAKPSIIESAYDGLEARPTFNPNALDEYLVVRKIITGGHSIATNTLVFNFNKTDLDAYLLNNAAKINEITVYKAEKLRVDLNVLLS